MAVSKGKGRKQVTTRPTKEATGMTLSKEMLAIIIGFAVIVLVGALFGGYQWGKGAGYDAGYVAGEEAGYDDGYAKGL